MSSEAQSSAVHRDEPRKRRKRSKKEVEEKDDAVPADKLRPSGKKSEEGVH